MTRCHWRWSVVALDVIGRSDPAWLRSFYTHTVVLTLITGNNNGGGGGGVYFSVIDFQAPYVFNKAPQASNPSRRSERHNAAASHVQSSSFKTREISTPLHTSSRLFPPHFTLKRGPESRQRLKSTCGNAESRSSTSWFRPPAAVPPERLFLLRRSSFERPEESSSSRSNQGTA